MNNILIFIILAVIIYFLIDYIYNQYLKSRINERFNNISGSYEKYKMLGNVINNIFYNNILKSQKKGKTESFMDPERLTYYKQYLYKLLSSNNDDKIIKINLKNSDENINLDFIFNNVLDHEKINEDPEINNIHTSIIINSNNLDETKYNISSDNCEFTDTDNYDINEYSWKINNISDDLKIFTIEFNKLNDNQEINKYKIIITLNKTLQELYSNNITFKQIISFIDNIELIYNDTNYNITSYSIIDLLFSEFTISRLSKYHKTMENIIETELLKDTYDNLKRFDRINADINKLENYYKFKKNLEKTYSNYKTLD
jgi:hypothetical protein